MAKQTICLVGRPNTGKSTLFNRIVGRKVAIIEDAPGVTRDRIYSQASFNEKPFYLIDTGGIDLTEGDFNEEIRMQVEVGIEEADTIIFVVDAKDGVTTSDELIRDIKAGISGGAEASLVKRLSECCDALYEKTEKLAADLKAVPGGSLAAANYYSDVIVSEMAAIRKDADLLEKLTAKSYWPYPTYSDILFY